MTANRSDDQLAIDREIDQVAHRFEYDLRSGNTLKIEDVLADHSSLGEGLVKELVWTEIEFRQARCLPIDWDDYAARFPQEITRLHEGQARQQAELSVDTSKNNVGNSIADTKIGASASSEEDPLLAPLDLRDYVLQTCLGKGGQGEVHLAQQLSLGRRVAIKMLKASSESDSKSVARFLREAKTLAQTQHPHIVTIHGIGQTNSGQLFLVMEYVQGEDLAKQLRTKTFAIAEAVRIIIQISQAIEHAHGRGVIHRDLKPSNVLWDSVRGPIVTDFGLAKDLRASDALTFTEQMMGTPAYMAPEQAHRQFGEIDERTDVYGLAATLFALLTSRPPFGPGPIAEVLSQLISDLPVPDPCLLRPEVPESLGRICRAGLAKRSFERFASVHDFAEELEKWLSGNLSESLNGSRSPVEAKTPTAAAEKLEPGSQFGRYRILNTLSSDWTRKVFRAEGPGGQSILLKCLPEEWLSDKLRRSQFRQEVLLSSRLSHPCLAKVVEAGVQGRTEFLALEYIAGESVSQVIAREGRLSESRVIAILQPIAEALHLIHQAGVIYRDLRPQNILLVEGSRPMLAEVRFSDELEANDMVTMSGFGDVTSKYVAPELLLGRTSDVASDVYTLGATLYAMLTGREPFAEAKDTLNLMLDKNAAKLCPARDFAPDLSEDILKLMDLSLRAAPGDRPASAAMFANALAFCGRTTTQDDNGASDPPSAGTESFEPPNLLHAVWDKLEPELQDAFSLAYNKKRRTGSSRISTRDLFEAMARLGTGPLRQVITMLPPGALPDATDPSVPIDRTVLREQPLLSDCVEDSLHHFQHIGPRQGAVKPLDLFVDIAKHGHGASVVKLREHGVDSNRIEQIVDDLGLHVFRRERLSNVKPRLIKQHETSDVRTLPSSEPPLIDENVQFSVYRPKAIPPETWEPLLAFAHLSELPFDAPEGTLDPIPEVRRQAEQVLGQNLPAYQSLTADSRQAIPRSDELTFVPNGDGLEFNPRHRSFRWLESVHREEFRFRADARLHGTNARGRLSVFLGQLLIAEVNLVVRVDKNASIASERPLVGEQRVSRFRKIYACVSPADVAVLTEFRRYAALMNDDFLTPQLQNESSSMTERDRKELISSADVFQLYWSRQSMNSQVLEGEWRHAISLCRPNFIRALYWEEPFPTDAARSLPPPELLSIGFQRIPITIETELSELADDCARLNLKDRESPHPNPLPAKPGRGDKTEVGDAPSSSPTKPSPLEQIRAKQQASQTNSQQEKQFRSSETFRMQSVKAPRSEAAVPVDSRDHPRPILRSDKPMSRSNNSRTLWIALSLLIGIVLGILTFWRN